MSHERFGASDLLPAGEKRIREGYRVPKAAGTGGPGGRELGSVVPYTTRPIRTGEQNGVTYYYETDAQFARDKAAGRILESRDYRTVHGVWHYYTKDDGQIRLEERSYLLIGTLESYLSFRNHYGPERVVPCTSSSTRGRDWSGRFAENVRSRRPGMRSCAGGSLRTNRISRRRSSLAPALPSDTGMTALTAAWKKCGRGYVGNRI